MIEDILFLLLILIQEGEPVKYHYFVISGLLKLIYTDDTEKQHIVSFAMEDWWESEFYAYYMQTDATMSLEYKEDTEVLCLLLDDYKRLCEGLQKMEHFFLQKVNFGFLAAQRRIISSLTSNPKSFKNNFSNNILPSFSAYPKVFSPRTWAFHAKH